jgi:hypothetical protein
MRVRCIEAQRKRKGLVAGRRLDEFESLLARVAGEVDRFPVELFVFLVKAGVIGVILDPRPTCR